MGKKYIRLKNIKDLVEVAIWSQTPVIHYMNVNDKHIYFIPYTILGYSSIVYFVENSDKIDSRFIVYNRYNGDLSYSDNVPTDTTLETIPIIEIAEQNVFDIKIFGKRKKKKKEEKK